MKENPKLNCFVHVIKSSYFKLGIVNLGFDSALFLSTFPDVPGLSGIGMDETDLVLCGPLLVPALVLRDEFLALPITCLHFGTGNRENDPVLFMFPFSIFPADLRVFFISTSFLKLILMIQFGAIIKLTVIRP